MTNNEQYRTALIVIDVQRALFEKPVPVHCADALLRNICTLMDRAHEHGLPVFIFRHANKSFLAHGSDGWQLHPALRPAATDILLDKTHGSGFQDTSFQQHLEQGKIDRLVVTGLVTNGCVRATIEDAIKRGYEVVLVRDGHSSYHRDAARIIDAYNQQLSEQGIAVIFAQAVQF